MSIALAKKYILPIIMIFGVMMSFGITPTVFAADDEPIPITNSSKEEACAALAALGKSCDTDAETEVTGTAQKVIDIISLIVGIAAVIVIVVAGFRFIVSGGDSTQVQNARNAILYAVVGLVVVILARTIVVFVLNRI